MPIRGCHIWNRYPRSTKPSKVQYRYFFILLLLCGDRSLRLRPSTPSASFVVALSDTLGAYSMTSQRSCLFTALVTPLLLESVLAVTNLSGWQGLRGAQIQKKLILQGGLLGNGTFTDGQWKGTSIVQHSYGINYEIDLTKSFDAHVDDTSTYLIPGLSETTNTQAPNYLYGGLLHNDYQYYTFGYVEHCHSNISNIFTVVLRTNHPSLA